MKLTRYYHKTLFDAGSIRALRDVLKSSFQWGFSEVKYDLHYPSEHYALNKIEEVDGTVSSLGQSTNVRIFFKSEGGRTLTVDTSDDGRIAILVDNRDDPPQKILDAIEPVLSLEKLGERTTNSVIVSAFIAHGFNDEGTSYANELARFLSLLDIHCESGRAFSPRRVSDKVNSRLAKHDLFVAIASPQEDYTWITQEIATAAALNKHVFVLKESGVDLKEGILGDHEYIPFPNGQLPKTFIPILEGLNEITGKDRARQRTKP